MGRGERYVYLVVGCKPEAEMKDRVREYYVEERIERAGGVVRRKCVFDSNKLRNAFSN